MSNNAGDRFEAAVDQAGGDGSEVRETLFGSMVRSAATAIVSVAASYLAGWAIKKLVDKGQSAKIRVDP